MSDNDNDNDSDNGLEIRFSELSIWARLGIVGGFLYLVWVVLGLIGVLLAVIG